MFPSEAWHFQLRGHIFLSSARVELRFFLSNSSSHTEHGGGKYLDYSFLVTDYEQQQFKSGSSANLENQPKFFNLVQSSHLSINCLLHETFSSQPFHPPLYSFHVQSKVFQAAFPPPIWSFFLVTLFKQYGNNV